MGDENWQAEVDQFQLAVNLFGNNQTYADNLAEAKSHL